MALRGPRMGVAIWKWGRETGEKEAYLQATGFDLTVICLVWYGAIRRASLLLLAGVS